MRDIISPTARKIADMLAERDSSMSDTNVFIADVIDEAVICLVGDMFQDLETESPEFAEKLKPYYETLLFEGR